MFLIKSRQKLALMLRVKAGFSHGFYQMRVFQCLDIQ